MQRRGLLVLGALVAGALALPPVLRRWPDDFDFKPLNGFPGFRRLASGAVTGGIDIFAGLGDDSRLAAATPPGDPCAALFGDPPVPDAALPVAVFSDVNCPNCRDLEDRLLILRDSGAGIRLIWHPLPLLGPSSVRAARAVIAAGLQGAQEAAHRYTMQRALPPGPSALRLMAETLGLNEKQFLRDVQSGQVTLLLEESLSLGRALGIPGTPGMVVGRTLVIGAMRQPDLARLIRLEQDTAMRVCA
ncbi:DsbA family protein [Roseobacter ponti]|uniref:Thioredoxin domain-containing protein n=1 Tax=Roseobacter ponti TaxID=1891787 RepID=A0A858SYE6_9RHOB|nr:DsbA family protein [Roseobacter ponti]QJF53018.1 thioredoxin domain-containing protein [Roseobacter ponti]